MHRDRIFFICASPLLGELLASLSLFLKDRFLSPAALVLVQMLAQLWQAPLRGNAFLPLQDLTLLEQLALWAGPRGSIALSGGCTLMVRKQPAVLNCPHDLVRVWTAQLTVHQARYLFLRTPTNKVEEIFLLEKKYSESYGKFCHEKLFGICMPKPELYQYQFRNYYFFLVRGHDLLCQQ